MVHPSEYITAVPVLWYYTVVLHWESSFPHWASAACGAPQSPASPLRVMQSAHILLAKMCIHFVGRARGAARANTYRRTRERIAIEILCRHGEAAVVEILCRHGEAAGIVAAAGAARRYAAGASGLHTVGTCSADGCLEGWRLTNAGTSRPSGCGRSRQFCGRSLRSLRRHVHWDGARHCNLPADVWTLLLRTVHRTVV
eukprot:COSAG02_NODE_6137_length_3776_cov_1.788686_1_plen_199_part_00